VLCLIVVPLTPSINLFAIQLNNNNNNNNGNNNKYRPDRLWVHPTAYPLGIRGSIPSGKAAGA
jgi:hypothetical protein